MQQRDHQRIVAYRAAVVTEVLRALAAGLGETGGNGRIAALVVALQRQRDAQVDQRQAGQRLAAFVVVQRAQRAQRRAVDPGQHVTGIRLVGELEVLAAIFTVELVATGQQVFAEAVECLLQHGVGHRETTVLGIQQELGDVRGQPRVHIAVVAPHREVAVGHLHRGQPPERAFHALAAGLGIQAIGAEHGRGRLVQHQRRVALAGGLLGAAIGVLQCIVERAGKRNRRQRADQHACGHRIAHQAIGQAAAHLHRTQRVQRAGLRAQDLRPGRAHRQVVTAVHLEAIAVHPQPHLGHGIAFARGQREAEGGLAVGLELQRAGRFPQGKRTDAVDLHLELARRAGEVLHVQGDRTAVARRHHPRHAGFGQDRRAHHRFHVALAVLVIGIHHRRHAQGAVEVRHLQRDPGDALGIELHRAGEQVHGLHARGGTLGLRHRRQCHVAAELELAAAAVEALDHAAVDVIGIHVQAALREEVAGRVGHREAGDVEDAHVHRRHGHVRDLARQLRRTHRHRQGLLGAHLLGRRQADRDLARLAVHRHVHHADRTGRGDLARRTAATEHQRGDVDVVALPFGGDRDVEGAARLGVDLLHIEHLVAFHHQDALAGMRRGDGDADLVAGLVAGLVQAQLDLVRACIQATVVVVPAPAGAERVAAGQPGGRIEHLQAVLAPLHRQVDRGGRSAGVDGTGVLVLEAAGEVVIPAVVVEGPVVVAQLAHQGDLQALGRLRLARGVHAHQFEARGAVGIGAVIGIEQRTHADQRRRRPHHPLQGAGDGAATGFVHAAGHHHRDRGGRLDLVGQRHVLAQRAVGGDFGVDDVACFARQRDGGVTEEVARQRFHRGLLGRHRQPRGEAVAVGGRAVQVGRIGDQLERLTRLEGLLGTVQVQLHALGQELLDAQGHALDGFLAGRVGAELHLPAPGRGFAGDGLFEAEVALLARLQAGFAEGLAVRLLQAQEDRLRLGRLAIVVAQQRGDAHRFAGAIQVTAGPGEHVEPGVVAPGHRELAQVQRRLVERQHRGVGTAAGDQHVAGIQGVVEQGVAVAVRAAFEHHLALAVEDAQLDLLQRRPALQRSGVHEQLVLVGAGVQADVADGEEGGVEFAFERAAALHHREVQAGLLQLLDLLGGQVGQHAFVLLAAQHEPVDVHRLGQLGHRHAIIVVAVQVPAAATPAALVLAEEGGQLVLAHAQELHVHFLHVHRHHRQAPAVLGRQHAALRGEAGHRLEFAGEHLLPQLLADPAAIGGQQVGRDDQVVFLGRLHERVAQGQAVIGQGPAAVLGAHLLGEADQRVEVLGAHQRARELQRQRYAVALLVGVGPHQGELADLLGLGRDRCAGRRGQLPAVVAVAAPDAHGQAGDQRQARDSLPAPLPDPTAASHDVAP